MKNTLRVASIVLIAVFHLFVNASATSHDNLAALLKKAKTRNVIRVIVVLRHPEAPTPFSINDWATQSSLISELQAQFVSNFVIDERQNLRFFTALPLVALDVTSDQLLRLTPNDLVARIVEDKPTAPALQETVKLIGAEDVFLHYERNGNAQLGDRQVVAVLDTGVHSSHTMLQGTIVSQACYSTNSAAYGGSKSLCPNGSAYQIDGDSAPDCDLGIAGCGHGTHVASIVVGNDGEGATGVAKNSKIIAIQVFSEFNDKDTCGEYGLRSPCALSYISDQIAGLQRTYRLLDMLDGYQIVAANMSLSGEMHSQPCNSDVRIRSIGFLYGRNVATVVASGNNGFDNAIGEPACIPMVVAVGSTEKPENNDTRLSKFSNHHDLVDLLAPGADIVAADAGGGLTTKSGTSAAAPHVAAAFALHRAIRGEKRVHEVMMDLVGNGRNGVVQHRSEVDRRSIDLQYLAP